MRQRWDVVSNSGQNAVVACGEEVIVINRPDGPNARAIFLQLTEGSVIDDLIVNILISPRKLAG